MYNQSLWAGGLGLIVMSYGLVGEIYAMEMSFFGNFLDTLSDKALKQRRTF